MKKIKERKPSKYLEMEKSKYQEIFFLSKKIIEIFIQVFRKSSMI